MTEGQLMQYPHWHGLHYGTDPRLLQAHALDIGSHNTGQLPATGIQNVRRSLPDMKHNFRWYLHTRYVRSYGSAL